MKKDIMSQIDEYYKKHDMKKRWQKYMFFLSFVVMFLTVYTLVIPAMTMENQEHVYTDNDDLSEENSPLNHSLVLEKYITNGQLSYRTSNNDDWVVVTESTVVPGNASLHLKVYYEDVPIDRLIESRYQMSYELPSIMQDITANARITSGTDEVGTIAVIDNMVILEFDETWLDNQKKNNQTLINGEFSVESHIHLSEADSNWPGKLVIGDVEISLIFEKDILAKYGEVLIDKSTPTWIDEGENGTYLAYTLTVTAGKDGAEQVKVTDTFTDNKEYVESYVIENNSETVQISDSGMVWEIGKMSPNEEKTLTYKVKVKDQYIGAANKGTITNVAKVYSKEYEVNYDSSRFTPVAKATLTKVASEYQLNDDGSGTITYTIWVQANENNTYTLDNVKIVDALDGSIDQGNGANRYTEEKYRTYLSYDVNSFKLYSGGSKNQNGPGNLTACDNAKKPVFSDHDGDQIYNDSFVFEVGSLSRGESKTLVYSLNVSPGIFMAAGNLNPQIKNRAIIYAVDEREENVPDQRLEAYSSIKDISKKVWNRKLIGERLGNELTLSMTENIYDATGDKIIPLNQPAQYVIPSGSYQYQVVVNEKGDWDISSAVMKDSFNSEYMEFCGYVRVDSYDISSHAPTNNQTNEQVIANLSNRPIVKTAWVKVDGKNTFKFKPQEIGLEEGNFAYLLTYYAKPVNIGSVTQININNSFTLSGDVKLNGILYQLPEVKVQASVIVEGGNNFAAAKTGWYYEKTKVTNGDFVKGALYWAIKVDGSIIPKDTRLKDTTNTGSGTTHYIRGTSLVGVYTGNLGNQSISDYKDLRSLEASGMLTDLDTSYYSVGKDNDSLTVQILKNITLGNADSLYIIIKTEPRDLPANVRDTKTYYNGLKSSSDGKNWIDHNTDSQVLYGNDGILKELNKILTWDGTTETVLTSNRNQSVLTEALTENGVYAIWQIQANYSGNLNGRYRIEEHIPPGMELVYVRYHWVGDGYGQNRPKTVQLSESEYNGYTEHSSNLISNNNAYRETVYYYTKDNTVFWDINGLLNGSGNNYGVEFQIACRVTDPDVLLGGESKQFTNRVILKNELGEEVAASASSAAIQSVTLTKSSTYDPEINGGRYPFTIRINPLGEDLVEKSERITLVDILGDNLILDSNSIKVVNSITGKTIENWTASIYDQTLELELPDYIPITITYETVVNARPGNSVSISNLAFWKGYTHSDSGSVEVENFSYTVGGTVGTQETPRVTIIKKDQNDTSLGLEGAVFKLQEGTFVNGIFTPSSDDVSFGTTGSNGEYIFDVNGGHKLKFNTIYCLTETKAPDHYILDAQPHYFAVAQKVGDDYPEFLEGVTVWYQSAHYTYQAYNHKGEMTVAKKFLSFDGHTSMPIAGDYTFGIYDTPVPEAEPLQTVTITYMNSDTESNKTAIFKNLDLDKKYYVFELDDDNQPIIQGHAGLVNKTPFIVTYQSNGAVNGETVTVINRCSGPELPKTGGTGGKMYTLGGLFLIATGLVLLYRKKYRKEEQETFKKIDENIKNE